MNFIKIAINLVILLCTFNYAYSVELVELNQRNLITLRGPIKHESVSDFLNKTSRVDSNEIYIYISSPGGSVMEGMKIVDLIKALEKSGKKVSCISDFSASMYGSKYATAFFITLADLTTWGKNILPSPNKSPTIFIPFIR